MTDTAIHPELALDLTALAQACMHCSQLRARRQRHDQISDEDIAGEQQQLRHLAAAYPLLFAEIATAWQLVQRKHGVGDVEHDQSTYASDVEREAASELERVGAAAAAVLHVDAARYVDGGVDQRTLDAGFAGMRHLEQLHRPLVSALVGARQALLEQHGVDVRVPAN